MRRRARAPLPKPRAWGRGAARNSATRLAVDVEADVWQLRAELDRERQADIAQADDGDADMVARRQCGSFHSELRVQRGGKSSKRPCTQRVAAGPLA